MVCPTGPPPLRLVDGAPAPAKEGCVQRLPMPSSQSHTISLAICSLLTRLLARLLGAGRALTRRLERRPLDGGDALLEACRARPQERGRLSKGLVGHLRLAQARFRVVVDGGAEAAREQPIAAGLACLALAARRRQARALRRLNDGLRRCTWRRAARPCPAARPRRPRARSPSASMNETDDVKCCELPVSRCFHELGPSSTPPNTPPNPYSHLTGPI